MKFEKFENIICWTKAEELTIECYKTFRNLKDFAFKDQIQRACVSVMNNIAEGYERMGNKEFKKFLYMAKGSSAEVRSMIHLALKLGYIDDTNQTKLKDLSMEISRMISGLIKSLK